MRIHAFLEHWGLINFNLEAANKGNNSIIPKAFNFKSPIYLDISTLTKTESIFLNNFIFIISSIIKFYVIRQILIIYIFINPLIFLF